MNASFEKNKQVNINLKEKIKEKIKKVIEGIKKTLYL